MGILDGILSPILQIINKVVPDPQAQAQIALQMAQLQQSEEFKQIDAQLAELQTQTDTNKAEATNASTFVSGWRPFVGWICGFGLVYQYLASPLLDWGSAIWHIPAPPTLDLGTLMTLLFGMLGLGATHAYENIQTKRVTNGN